MDLNEAILARKSIRAYKPDPVTGDILRKVLETSRWAASGVNWQPWEILALTGEPLKKVCRMNMERAEAGAPRVPDIGIEVRLEGVYRERQVENAKQLYGLLGISREDREKRTEWDKRGFRFFDAPAALILVTDRSLDPLRSHFDVGAIAQVICLTAVSYGLGTCLEMQGINFPDVIRSVTGLPDSKRMVISIAIGYPDWSHPANRLRTKREAVDSFVQWFGFDQG